MSLVTTEVEILDGASMETMPWRSSIRFAREAYEEIQWLIPGILPKGGIVLLCGKAGAMKSFLALSMAYAVASGTAWLGRQTKQGSVLYLDGENPPALLQARLQGIGTAEGLNIWSFFDKTFPQSLQHPELQRAAATHSLIVVDTLRRQMGRLREDFADDMAQITNDLKELARHGATVLVLHHAPKNPTRSGPRGSSELEAGCDVSVSVTKHKKGKEILLTLEMPKSRYLPDSDDLEIEVTRGDKAPRFTIQGAEEPQKDLYQLVQLVDTLRERLGRDPNRTMIIGEAEDAGFGGRARVEPLLDEGEGVCWRRYKPGREVLYAPPGT